MRSYMLTQIKSIKSINLINPINSIESIALIASINTINHLDSINSLSLYILLKQYLSSVFKVFSILPTKAPNYCISSILILLLRIKVASASPTGTMSLSLSCSLVTPEISSISFVALKATLRFLSCLDSSTILRPASCALFSKNCLTRFVVGVPFFSPEINKRVSSFCFSVIDSINADLFCPIFSFWLSSAISIYPWGVFCLTLAIDFILSLFILYHTFYILSSIRKIYTKKALDNNILRVYTVIEMRNGQTILYQFHSVRYAGLGWLTGIEL